MSKGFGKGRSPTKFSYTYEDLARIVGCTPQAVCKHAQRGNFDPKDLISVLEFVRDRLTTEDGESLEEQLERSPQTERPRLVRKAPKEK